MAVLLEHGVLWRIRQTGGTMMIDEMKYEQCHFDSRDLGHSGGHGICDPDLQNKEKGSWLILTSDTAASPSGLR